MLWMAVIGGAYWFLVNVYWKEIRILASVQDDVDKFEEVKCSPEHAEKPQGSGNSVFPFLYFSSFEMHSDKMRTTCSRRALGSARNRGSQANGN